MVIISGKERNKPTRTESTGRAATEEVDETKLPQLTKCMKILL